MDNAISVSADKRIPTRQKILSNAVDLFATKGYTETSVRDIATAVGINASSLYNHFKSKEDILRFLLNSFGEQTENIFKNPDLPDILRSNPTVDGLLSCFDASLEMFSDDRSFRTLQMVYQEHHRNELIREYVSNTMLESEKYMENIFAILKELNIIKQDANPDFWKKITSSLLYTFPNRTMIGIGSGSSAYTGMDLRDLLFYMFSLMFKLYSIADT